LNGTKVAIASPLLQIRELVLDLETHGQRVRVLDAISLSVDPGETVCLVGESGSGKSLTALSIARLIPEPPAHYRGGEVLLCSRDVLQMHPEELRAIRGRVVSYIFQEPSVYLNPVFRIGTQIKESLKLHQPEKANDAEVVRLLGAVGIASPGLRARDYPHQLSGGMQQRAMIAMAIASEPSLLVADEPTTALDTTTQAQILQLLQSLTKQLGMAMLFITHNLGIVAEMADRLVVLYAGQVVESGPPLEILTRPRHPYTRALIDSVPELHGSAAGLRSIPGSVPKLGHYDIGCRFAARCPHQKPECDASPPPLTEDSLGRRVRCFFPLETNGPAK